jgi:hypothetical protein
MEAQRQYPSQTPEEKSHGVKSGDRGGHRINALSSCPVCPIHLCGKIKKKKNLERFILHRCKNYHDPMHSLFVVNF